MISKKQFQRSLWSPRATEVEASAPHVPNCKHNLRDEFDERVCTYCGTRWYPNPYSKNPKWITATTDNRHIPEGERVVERKGHHGGKKPKKPE